MKKRTSTKADMTRSQQKKTASHKTHSKAHHKHNHTTTEHEDALEQLLGIDNEENITKLIAAFAGLMDSMPIEEMMKGVFKSPKEEKALASVLQEIRMIAATAASEAKSHEHKHK